MFNQELKDDGFNFPEDTAHENGNYNNLCCKCKVTFVGHKRRVLCKRCEDAQTIRPTKCPFCGNNNIVIHPNSLAIFGCEMGHPEIDVFYAHCDQCGSDGPQSDCETEAIKLWNKRIW